MSKVSITLKYHYFEVRSDLWNSWIWRSQEWERITAVDDVLYDLIYFDCGWKNFFSQVQSQYNLEVSSLWGMTLFRINKTCPWI